MSNFLSISLSFPITVPDEFIDVILGNRVYMKCIYVSWAALGN